jgi:PKD repeat protein
MKRYAFLFVAAVVLPLISTQAVFADGDFVWAGAMGGTSEDTGRCIAVDSAGNVYTTGRFYGTADFDPGLGTYNLTSAGYCDVFVSKLDANGNFVWARSVGGTDYVEGYGIAVDSAGNVYTTGGFYGTADFDPGPGTYNLTTGVDGDDDIFVSKLDANGNFVWAKSMGPGWGVGEAIAVDSAGNVCTTGSFQGTVDFDPGAGTYNLTSAGDDDVFMSKLDSNGNFVWAKSMGGTSTDWGRAIAFDSADNVYTTGVFQETVDFDPGPGIYNLYSAGFRDIFVSKLDSSGNFVWAKSMGGAGCDEGYGIAVDSTGNVYTTGELEGTADFDPGAGTYNLTSAGHYDICVSKLDSSGNFIWARSMGGTEGDEGICIAVDSAGSVHTTGRFQGTADFDPGAGTYNLTSAGQWDTFVSKLDSSGNFVWAKSTGGASWEERDGIAVDSSGNVYTTGEFQDAADFDPGPGTYSLTSAGDWDIFVSKLDGPDDIDYDGLLNEVETNTGIYVDETDTGTDPHDPDTDDDGLTDGWEVENGLDPNDGTGDNGAEGDLDGDGLTNIEEYNNNTDPNDADSDDDGLTDGEEVNTYGTDPNDVDSDDDGLTDDEEVHTHSTDPNDPDSDGDGLPDVWEVDNDLDPTDNTGDNGADGDLDDDGLTNSEEYDLGTDPSDADSDDDGLTDGWEVDNGYDPQLHAPAAAFSASATSGVRPLAVDFTDETPGSVTDWEWDFDDGYDSTEQNPSHTYYFTGNYSVTLTVTGPGGVGSATETVNVDQALPADGLTYKVVIDGVKVAYSRPTCFACYNDLQGSLLIAVWGDEPGVLKVIAEEDAPLHWNDRRDVVIDAPGTYIKKVIAKGIQGQMDLYVCGRVGYVKNFILKDGYVGGTLHYGEEFGLGSDALERSKKILIKRGAATAPVLGIGYPELRFIPTSVEEALAHLEEEIRLKSKPLVESELADYDYDYEYEYDYDRDEDEDIKLAELAFDEVEASVETKAAYVVDIDGVKVRYSLPGCVAYYNDDDGTLTVEVSQRGGDLLVKCGEDAYLVWGDYCDVYIDAPDVSINNVMLKGNPETQLNVVGSVSYVNNFKLKYGCVGDTGHYDEDFGLGCTSSLVPPNKILLKWGWTTAPLLGVSY